MAQQGARLAAEAAQEGILRVLWGVGVPDTAAPVAAGGPEVQPVGGLIERGAVTLQVNESLEQDAPVAERLQPIPREAPLAQGSDLRYARLGSGGSRRAERNIGCYLASSCSRVYCCR